MFFICSSVVLISFASVSILFSVFYAIVVKVNVSRGTFAALSAVRAGCAGWGEASPVPRCRDDWNGALLVRSSAD